MNYRTVATLSLATSLLFATVYMQADAIAAAGDALATQAATQASTPALNPAASASAKMALPPGHVPIAAAPLPKDKLLIQGYSAPLPPSWTAVQPTSRMRFAQFTVPAAPGSQAGEALAYYFPVGQGGSNEANIGRWAAEFSSANGKPAVPKVSTSKTGAFELTLVTLQGNYARGNGMITTAKPKADQMLLVAIVTTPAGRIMLQLYGSSKTVLAQRANFLGLAQGFHLV